MYSKPIIEAAIIKFKHYCYEEKTNLFIREKLAKFLESSNGDMIERLLNISDDEIDLLVHEVNFRYLHKAVSDKADNSKKQLKPDPYKSFNFSNVVDNNSELSSFNFFIDVPIELHILTCCWLVKYGSFLESQILPCAYGNRLNINRDTGKLKFHSQSLYKKYYDQFQNWRDRCVTTAKSFLEKKNNVSIINLDLKRFYYNINIDFNEISHFLQKSTLEYDFRETELLSKVHLKFSESIGIKDKIVLPLGLISSGLLSNWYMRNFDSFIQKKLRPLYYGRYVDDILIVLSNPVIQDTRNPKHDIFSILKSAKIIHKKAKDDHFIKIFKDLEKKKNVFDELPLQAEKVLVHYFDSNAPLVLIDKFYEELKKQSSEYRFLPDEKDLNKSFLDEAYNIIYGASNFIYREIKDIKPNKNGISSFFRKASILALFSKQNDPSTQKTSQEIFSFFNGKIILEYSSFWERAFTYFVISKQTFYIDMLYQKILRNIDLIEINTAKSHTDLKANYNTEQIKRDLIEYLNISLSTALALNSSLLEHITLSKRIVSSEKQRISDGTKTIRKTNLFRSNYCYWPLINLFDDLLSSDFDFTSYQPNWLELVSKESFKKIKFSNSYKHIYFHEIQFLLLCKAIFIDENPTEIQSDNFLTTSKEIYSQIYPFLSDVVSANIQSVSVGNIDVLKLSSKATENCKISIVSKRIEPKSILRDFLLNDGDFVSDFKEFCKILNETELEKADICVFPECSISFQFLPLFLKESTHKNRAFSFGLKHLAHKDTVFNFTVLIAPYESMGFSSSCLIIRPKNFPAPSELELFENEISRTPHSTSPYKFHLPDTPYYNIVQWKGISLSVFNCFELADIQSRSLMKSLLDLLIVVEFNKDIPYFASLIESSSRDLHSYVVQVNNSLYGDSRITQPSKTDSKNIVQIKGGDNSYIVVGTIKIDDLRNFQLTTYSKQLHNDQFKPIPPDYDVEAVKSRGNFELLVSRLNKKRA